MNFKTYQKDAATTALYPRPSDGSFPSYPALGLAGEAGEVCEKVKKCIRDDNGHMTEERRQLLQKELGDVLWYLAALCTELGIELEDVAQQNLDKLFDRAERGKIQGSGDER